jgi:zinc transporter ZupT
VLPSRSPSPAADPRALPRVLAGVLLYLATSDILPEAHAHHPTRLTLACTIVGVGVMWLVIGLAS